MTSKRPRRQHSGAAVPTAPTSRARKAKLSGSIIAISSAAIVSIYTLGRANTSAAFDQLTVDAPTVAATLVVPTTQAAGSVRGAPTVAPSANRAQPTAAPTLTATYKDGTYTGSGNSRHGGMQVSVVIKDGKISSANVTSCSTRYPCSDINPLIRAVVSQQTAPVNHISGATDSSQAYKQAVNSALKQAKA